ncbi:hypothetical protein DENSPDRAFT_674335 [Dentipellis sp. KUC8613]|nr:hypothetical protein DENSPDRAFT_674335 [Dentipellis sp. KUC8613]
MLSLLARATIRPICLLCMCYCYYDAIYPCCWASCDNVSALECSVVLAEREYQFSETHCIEWIVAKVGAVGPLPIIDVVAPTHVLLSRYLPSLHHQCMPRICASFVSGTVLFRGSLIYSCCLSGSKTATDTSLLSSVPI